jgi:DNA-binding NarL/FixJ family response regulator
MIVKIAICEDDSKFSSELKSQLLKTPGFSVVGIASNRSEVDILLGFDDVDLYFVDLGFPDISGIDVVEKIKKTYPHSKVVVLTSFSGRRSISQCLELGVNGYVFKDEIFFNLEKCVIDVMRDGASLSPQVASILIETLSAKPSSSPSNQHTRFSAAIDYGLSQKEFSVLELVAQGIPNHVIGDTLSVSIHTVNKHLQSMYKKLGVHSKIAAIKTARHLGLVE